jgi:acetate kinase
MRVLFLNAGSQTVKASLIEDGLTIAREVADTPDPVGGLEVLLERFPSGPPPDAVAHRQVHGGERFIAPVIADEAVVRDLRGLVPLAPLHMPPALRILDAARARFPELPHVCCFDTAFHATLPDAEWRYPVPAAWWTEWGIRRYGFHGLSVDWSVGRVAELLGKPADGLGVVVAHLGGGCSVTAVLGGRSVRTSMGYTPLEGLMMATRSGSIDPGITAALLRDGRLTLDELMRALEHESGLLGVSGVSGDLRAVEAAADAGNVQAALAIRMFVARTAAGIAAAATALTRLDAIVFTGGIGEHAGRVRAAIVAQLAVLGVAPVDPSEPGSDSVLSSATAGPCVVRVEAREDLICARQAEALLVARG